MALYAAAVGHNIALGSLITIAPQPRTDVTTQPVQRNASASGGVHEQGLFIVLQWSMLDPTTEYAALLDQFGLGADAVPQANVTLYCPNFEYVFTRYNGIAVRPEQGTDIKRSNTFIVDVSIIVKNLVALA